MSDDSHDRASSVEGRTRQAGELAGAGVSESILAEIERYRTLAEGATDGIFLSDAAGRYVDVNAAACEMLRYNRDELLGLSIADIIAPEETRRLPSEISRLSGTPVKSEWVFRRKDGSTFDGEVNARQLPDSRLLAVVRDVTPLQDALRSLRESESRFRALVDDLEVGVVLQDSEDRILIANKAARSLLGITVDEPTGLTSRDPRWQLIQEDGTNFPADRVPSVLAARTGHAVRNVLIGALNLETRTRKWLQVTASPRFEGGSLKHVLVTIIDATDRLLLEEQLRQSQKMQAIGQLAGGVAHDFNNVLTVVANYSDMLLRDLADASPSVREALQAIRDAGERAALLTRQLLVFSRKAMVEPRVLDMNSIIRHAVQMLRRLIPENIALTTELAADLSLVKLDPGQVEQIILNLALNARDSMTHGGSLTIATRNAVLVADALPRGLPEARPGRFTQLVVSDTGIGMSTEVRSHLFEPFFTTKEVGKGTGLGLATVYGIVRASGGFITVTTEEGAGTTVMVYLPVSYEPVTPQHEQRPSARRSRGSETILLVEDEDAVRHVVRHALESEGYSVMEAAHGRSALEIMERQGTQVDLLLSDVIMPTMNGRELASQVTARFPGCRVLLMSGYFNEMHDAAANSFPLLRKPFSLAELSEKVREVLTRGTS